MKDHLILVYILVFYNILLSWLLPLDGFQFFFCVTVKTIYSARCSSLDFGSECLQRRKKSLSVFVLDSKTKEDDKIVVQSVGFEISRERQGLLLQSRKMAKRRQSIWKTHWNNREIEFHEFLSERSELFRPRSGQASDKFATGPAP